MVLKSKALRQPPPTASARTHGNRTPASTAFPPEITLSTSLAHSAYRVKCIETLWDLQSPNNGHACELSTVVWITSVQDMPIFQHSRPLQKSILALCLAILGRREKTEWMAHHGLQLYGDAIKTLSAALDRLPTSTPPSDDMLVTTRVLAMHEVISTALDPSPSADDDS